MHFWIQHNEISKTHLFLFLPQKKSFFLQASVISYTSRQMSVKRVRLHIKVNPKIYDNLGHRETSTRSSQPHNLFVRLPGVLTLPLPLPKPSHFYIEPHTHWHMWENERNFYFK